MIQFEDPKFGKVVIYDEFDVVTPENFSDEIIRPQGYRRLTHMASVIGFRNRKKGIVKLLKNRYGTVFDEKMKKFIFNYEIEEEVFELIESRFDILEL